MNFHTNTNFCVFWSFFLLNEVFSKKPLTNSKKSDILILTKNELDCLKQLFKM